MLRGGFHNSAEIMREISTRKQAIQRAVELATRAVEKRGRVVTSPPCGANGAASCGDGVLFCGDDNLLGHDQASRRDKA